MLVIAHVAVAIMSAFVWAAVFQDRRAQRKRERAAAMKVAPFKDVDMTPLD